ncbi:MAG: CO/xanthine dehydrogenase Mo-binding subunit [Gammaproteobacteria bacterium]|jgi:CO/xanthine dehydrogenase Mo-binding subunit
MGKEETQFDTAAPSVKSNGYRVVGTRPIRPDGIEKVTGRANFGADCDLPGMLTGWVVRSPHAHAKILSIDTSKAMKLAGVKAVLTAADFPELSPKHRGAGEAPVSFRDMSRNIMARDKALYDGHAVAAVAATTPAIAEAAAALIEVKYKVLPHVLDARAAMKSKAPVLHNDIFTKGVDPKPSKASNVAQRYEFSLGDIDAGFADADVTVEHDFTSQCVHQGYIEPHACVASTTQDGMATVWASSQGQFMVRNYCATVCGMDISKIRVMPAEIGGGFGGKTVVYLEPLAILLSKKSGKPIKIVMNREDVFRATGPTSGGHAWVKIGAKKDGTMVAGELIMEYEAGAFAGSPVHLGCMTGFAPYTIPNSKSVGFDVVVNRPKAAAYRAPGAPIAAFAVESAIDILARKLGMDPIALREKNAASEGTQAAYGPKFQKIGFVETLEAAKNHPHYSIPLGPNQGRGVASGFWFNIGGESSAAVHINEDGTVDVVTANPDIGGSRASMGIMAAEVLGIDVSRVKPIIADTASSAYSMLTGGSRVTFAVGQAVCLATDQVVAQLCERAAKIWDIEVSDVEWFAGSAVNRKSGKGETLSLADIANVAGKTGGPITGQSSSDVQGAGPGFGTHICDVEVDPETGRTTVIRYTAIQDVGTAIHPSYVEGQLQGGAAQGVGWALNEEYIYDDLGRLQNGGFLDYRIPVASDLPMIDTVLVEVPNPNHRFGVRGVGEVPIVPPLAAVANAVSAAAGIRMADLPISPPKLLAAMDAK